MQTLLIRALHPSQPHVHSSQAICEDSSEVHTHRRYHFCWELSLMRKALFIKCFKLCQTVRYLQQLS